MTVSRESVQQLLNSDDFGNRLSGVNLLRQLEPAIAFELIQPIVQDTNARVRYAAVSQLDTLGKQDLSLTFTLLRDRLLNDSEPDVQAAAADALGALQMTEAFEEMQQLYHQSSEWLLQFSIVAALGELADPRAFPLLEEALSSETSLIQTAAISSLGELGDPRAVPLLVPFATDSDWQVRYRVAQALKPFKTSEARAALEALAQDSVEQVAQEAKRNL